MGVMRLAIVAIFLCAQAGAAQALSAEQVEFFEKRIRPVLVEHCYKCHSATSEKIKGGLRLDTKAGLLKGGETRAAVVPGDVAKSLLIEAVKYGDTVQMPPKYKLTDAQIAGLEAWVKMGAPDPRVETVAAAASSGIDVESARKKWPFTPVSKVEFPRVKDEEWVRNEIDRFVLARLEKEGMTPAARADKRTLIRRATFDLIGLPPTPQEVEAFIKDESPEAFAKVVDRLLASPLYGQRYARHWLDVVRYTDSFDARGIGGPMDCADAWRYRDWVVEAMNGDLPYDRFVKAQVAGDLTGEVIATGVFAIGNWGGGDADKEKLLTDIADDQVDLVGRAFLGMTLACARCHDHKFDPITTQDYYGLAGMFFSSHILPDVGPKTNGPTMLRIPLASKEELARREKIKQQIAELEKEKKAVGVPLAAFKAMGNVVEGVAEIPGLIAVSHPGKAEPPSATINTTQRPLSFSTIKMPPRSVAVHPGPRTAVAAVFTSPDSGEMFVSSALADIDPNCGDGIDYRLVHRQGDSAREVARGSLKNGGRAEASGRVTVARGDRVELIVLRKGEYTCDTTMVDLRISSSARRWDLRADVLAHETVALPAGDAYGNGGVWSFAEVVDSDPRVAALKAELDRQLPSTHGLQEGGVPGSPHAGVHDVKVHIRGRYDRLGETAPRRFPRVIAGDAQPTISIGSGRKELAEWLASPANPLTARVMVNRIWQWHFGEGIVRSGGNFGKLGTPPTHPQLLDWLAGKFVEQGWSMKAMHRLIMLSATYQQASSPAPGLARDPENLLFGRMNRRRLDAEQLRDALLFVTGELEVAHGGPAVKDLSSPRRTLYLMTVRSDRSSYRMLFDAADPTAIIDKRVDSTVAPQALFLLNHPFVTARAEKLAGTRDADALYQRLFGRNGTQREREMSAKFSSAWQQFCHALLCSNEFMYVD